MLLPGPDLHCVGLLALSRFRNIFLPTIGENQKKVSPAGAGPLVDTVPHIILNPAQVSALCSQKD